MKVLHVVWNNGTYGDATWQYTIERDPFELERVRKKQRAYVGKYLHQAWGYWDDRDVNDLVDAVEEANNLVKEENKSRRIDV